MEKNNQDFNLTENAKNLLISKLTDELLFLRTKLGLSQEEISDLLGVSRQTYSTIETKRRPMSWSMYLSLILIFDNNEQTHEIIRNLGIFPFMLFGTTEKEGNVGQIANASGLIAEDIRGKLDEQALHAIETVIMVEYARCNNMSGEAVIKAFNGRHFINVNSNDESIANALNALKMGNE